MGLIITPNSGRNLPGSEKFHSAIVPHEGSEHGRIFQQAAKIGAEIKRFSDEVVGSRIAAEVAIMMDWQNWWAVEYLPGPSDRVRYWEEIKAYYYALVPKKCTS